MAVSNRWIALALASSSFAFGCGGGEDPPETGETGSSGIAVDDDGDPFDSASLDESSTGLGDSTDDGTAPPLQCTKVDFLFVVDNSSSMADEQQFLAQAVPGFVEAMKNTLPTVEDFRVGVIDTDSYPAIGTLENPLDGCPEGTDCSTCDYSLGAALTRPQSAEDSSLDCGFSTGTRYMDGNSENFASEFQCAALVGTGGNPIEQQAGALVAAVSEPMRGTAGCNEGIVRSDALLVFLVITDEEDNHASAPEPQGGSDGEPDGWYAKIVEAKDGRDNNVVALGLLGGSPKFSDCADLSEGVDGAEQTSRLVDFVERFPVNFVGSVCSEGYAEFFVDALEKVSEGCTNFIPG